MQMMPDLLTALETQVWPVVGWGMCSPGFALHFVLK
jgi:hypothetical protein